MRANYFVVLLVTIMVHQCQSERLSDSEIASYLTSLGTPVLRDSSLSTNNSCINELLDYSLQMGVFTLRRFDCGSNCVKGNTCSTLCDCKAKSAEKKSDFTCQKFSKFNDLSTVSSDYCEINGDKISDCGTNPDEYQETLFWFWVNSKVFYPSEYKLIETDYTEFAHSTCTGKCEGLNCEVGECSGTKLFCHHYSCKQNSDCFCKEKNKKMTLIVEGQEIEPICWGFKKSLVKKEKIIIDETYLSDDSFSFSCSNGYLNLKLMTSKVNFAKVCVNPKCSLMPITQGENRIKLDQEQVISKSNARVSLLSKTSGQIIQTRSSPCFESCPPINCYFCMEVFRNYECANQIQRAVATLEFITGLFILSLFLYCLLSIIKIIILIYMPIKIIFKVLTYPFKVLLRKLLKKCSNSYTKLRDNDWDLEKEPMKKQVPLEFTMRPIVKKSPPLHSIVLLSLVFIVSIHYVESCSESTTISLTSKDCRYEANGMESCLVTSKSRLALSPIGQDSCFNIQNPDGRSIGNLVVTTKSIRTICKREDLYYTFSPSISCPSVHNCYKAGSCHGDAPCSIDSSHEIKELGSDNNYLGWSKCERTSGCAGNGCFYCTQSCIFYRTVIKNPSKEVYEVFECPTWSYEVDVDVKFMTLENIKSQVLNLQPGIKLSAFGIKFSLISISSPPKPFLEQCFLKKGLLTAMTPCNKRGTYSIGQVGEIQCPTYDSAKSASKSCFALESIISVTRNDQSVSCSSGVVDLENLFSTSLLPIKKQGLSIIGDNNKIELLETSSALLEIQLESSKLKLSSRTDSNKCFINFVSLSGCYSCSSAASFKYSGKTDFGSATAMIVCPDSSVSFPISLDSDLRDYEKTILFNKQEISETCYVECPAGKTEFKMTGSLVYIPNQIFSISQSNSEANTFSSIGISLGSSFLNNKLFMITIPFVLLLSFIAISFVSSSLRSSKRKSY